MENLKRITWKTHEFKEEKKASDWFWYVGFIAVLVSIISLYLGNFTFAVLSIIGGFVLIIEGGRPPKKHTYSVSRKGVHVEDTTIEYEDINSFAIHEEEEFPHLVLSTNKALRRNIILPLSDAPIEKVHKLLEYYIPEEIQELPLSEHLARRIGL
jgi:hypothetical protein